MLCAELADGQEAVGESRIPLSAMAIRHVYLEPPHPALNPEAAQAIDQSFSLAAVSIDFNNDGIPDFTTHASVFTEIAGVDNLYTDCARTSFIGQGAVNDTDS